MPLFRILFTLFFILLAFSVSKATAATVYRHVPFSATISSGDKVVVNYDFQSKTGIRCQANNNHVWISFTYKGREKSDRLPILLENDHLPENEIEVLADSKGQFTLTVDNHETRARRIAIYCDY